VLFWLLRALPREGHSHFKMTGSILVGNAWILVVRLQYESVAFSIYPVVFSIFQLIRTKKRNVVIVLIFIVKSRTVDRHQIGIIYGNTNNTYKKLALDIQSRCDSSMNTS